MANVVLVKARLIFDDPKALRALVKVAELADEIAEDQPWNENAVTLGKAARYALRHVAAQVLEVNEPS